MKNGSKSRVARKRVVTNDSESGVELSSGNVFADLGLPNPECLLLKATLVHRIRDLIDARGLTQAQAASVLKIDQPKVSDLVRGRTLGFSLERMFRFLHALDQRIEIAIRPANGKQDKRIAVLG